MATNTYVALDKVTVGTAVNSVTFSNISQNYTDLVIVANFTGSGSGNNLMMQVGNTTIDTGSNYSGTGMYGNGTSAFSWRQSNNSAIQATYAIGLEALNVSSIHLMNYSNTTTYKTVLNRSGGLSGTYNATEATVSLWRSTAAINTIKLYGLNSATISAGSTFSLYGIKAWADETTPKATGGYVYSDSTYWYHAFPFSSTFTPNQSLSCDYLVVAGGGGGYFSGAGAGGLRQGSSFSVTATSYAITVGAGGAPNADGTTSIFSTISATGGGHGVVAANGQAGGSGGGAGSVQADPGVTGGSGNAGGYTPVEGYAGGNAVASYGTNTGQQNSGGGGGAGGAGSNGSVSVGGNGGIGATSALINAIGAATPYGQGSNGNYYFAGGGGGGGITNGAGGLGGGGTGIGNIAYSGLPQTGGGGSGATWGPTRYSYGGSGIVVIRYAK